MNADVSRKIAVAFAQQVAAARGRGLCSTCVTLLGVGGVGITIMAGGQAGPMCMSSPMVEALEDLQFTTGVGPCREAYRSRLPIETPEFGSQAAARWPTFVDLAHTLGVGAVFAYPLSIRGTCIGVLSLYQFVSGALSPSQNEDRAVLVEVVTEAVLGLQAAAPAGTLAPGLEEVVAYRSEIHQAAGMVAIQLHIPVAEALLRIRAHSFADGRPVAVIAADIVGRRLRLADDRHHLGEEE